MPIGAITMILTNVSLQIYNNWCGSRQNKQIQQKREEFERAAKERNTERMWKLMREGQELTKQLEEENHQYRLKELKDDVGNLLKRLAYSATINNWPLNVLPIVMKNQALGNLLANQEERIALHCILTPSNNSSFNKSVFPLVEDALETYCNLHWSMLTDHPVLFYSGAWKSSTSPTEVQIDSMRTALSNLPVLCITPFFRPDDDKLVFQVRIWGVGASINDEFTSTEIEPTEFQIDYTMPLDYANDSDIVSDAVEDIVPYLQCLIGYMADTYFWSSSGLAPIFPMLLTNGAINTDGMKYLINDSKEYYENLLSTSETGSKEQPFAETNELELYKGSSCFWDEETKTDNLEKIFTSYCSKHAGTVFHSMSECLNVENFTKEDLPFIKKFREEYNSQRYSKELDEIQSVLESIDFDYSILDSTEISYLEDLANKGNGAAMFRLGEIYEYSINIEKYDGEKANLYYNDALKKDFFLAKVYCLIHDDSTDIIRDLSDLELYILNYLHANSVVVSSVFLSQYYFYCQNKNKQKILSYLEEAPDTTHPYLYYWAAKVLIELYGSNEIKSVEYNLAKSAKFGYIEAQLLLMRSYQKGGFFTENPEKVFEYSKMAARQGALQAIYKMGVCLITGYGTLKNKDKGLDFIKYAAKKGDKSSIELLKRL